MLGVRGIDMLAAACEGLPLDLFFMASSCVPATAWEDAGAVLGPGEVKTLLSRPRVLGLAEVMDIPAVLARRAGRAGEGGDGPGGRARRRRPCRRSVGPGADRLRGRRHPLRP